MQRIRSSMMTNVTILKKNGNYGSGFWNAFLFTHGKTNVFHTEKDCAYIFVMVPTQTHQRKIILSDKPQFLFKIDEEQQLILLLPHNLAFLYNASFLTRCKCYTPSTDSHSLRFYNISSYANERLSSHLHT